MRQIKFRGTASPQHPWVYGDYHRSYDGSFYNLISTIDPEEMQTTDYPVDENSVGQFTGLLDKNGKEIYEGDIISFIDVRYNKRTIRTVEWSIDGAAFFPLLHYCQDIYIIGNIYQNPELINHKS